MRFNNQDASVMRDVTDFIKRQGLAGTLSPLTRLDDFHTEFRKLANEHARGVGTKWKEPKAEATIASDTAVAAKESPSRGVAAQSAG